MRSTEVAKANRDLVDCLPNDITPLAGKRLRSRFEWGLIADKSSPD